ncbi:replication-associated recombination protein A [Candidatus Beckwithbacteria bacterium]|nr:replication-associated recombination protein A [Candidatus Beckwithbacteria bacterium]
MDFSVPLAEQLRPQNLSEFVGQEHLVGKGKPIRTMVEHGTLYSMIFWGPPGCGKTTLAKLIAKAVNAQFYYLSAVSAGKKDIQNIVKKSKKLENEQLELASEKKSENTKTVLFLDEIHRFNKAQQDYLLPYVEDGTITLIGATTENPSFEVISALLSRSRVYVLKPLTSEKIAILTKRALKTVNLSVEKKALDFLSSFANGDARIALGVVQIAKETSSQSKITLQLIKDILQKKTLLYDKHADQHYDTISAFIKSMRASDVDAALYYLARMIEAGEDPKFIARRMVVFASEDVATPTALVVANAVFRACETVGYPECQENLAAGVAYLAQAPKDRRAYDAYMAALKDVKNYGNLSIPLSIRNAPTNLMKELGYGKGYQKYTKESLLPEKLKGKKYYDK